MLNDYVAVIINTKIRVNKYSNYNYIYKLMPHFVIIGLDRD